MNKFDTRGNNTETIDRIIAYYDSYSAVEKRIADYILSHQDEIALHHTRYRAEDRHHCSLRNRDRHVPVRQFETTVLLGGIDSGEQRVCRKEKIRANHPSWSLSQTCPGSGCTCSCRLQNVFVLQNEIRKNLEAKRQEEGSHCHFQNDSYLHLSHVQHW